MKRKIKMKKQTTTIIATIIATIICMIFMINLVSAISGINMVAGDSYTFESEEFEYWSAIGNQSSMEGLTASWENGNTTISLHPLYKPDTFTLIFFNTEKEVITEYVYSGGGGGGGRRIVYVDRNNTEYLLIGNEKIVDEEIVGESCATVSPDSRQECCINKGYELYDEETGLCNNVDEIIEPEEFNWRLFVIIIIICLIIMFFIALYYYLKSNALENQNENETYEPPIQ